MKNVTKVQLEQVHKKIIHREANSPRLDLVIMGRAMEAGIKLLTDNDEVTDEFQNFKKTEKSKTLQAKLNNLRSGAGLHLIPLEEVYKDIE